MIIIVHIRRNGNGPGFYGDIDYTEGAENKTRTIFSSDILDSKESVLAACKKWFAEFRQEVDFFEDN